MYSLINSIHIPSTYSKLGTSKVIFSAQVSSSAYWGEINNCGKHLMLVTNHPKTWRLKARKATFHGFYGSGISEQLNRVALSWGLSWEHSPMLTGAE